jgi:HK97 family phage major capsid protein
MKTFTILMALVVAAALFFDPSAAFAMGSLGSAAQAVPSGLPLLGSLAAAAAVSAPRIRGVLSARADANPVEIVNQLTRTFEAFKVANDKEIADLKAGRADVVQTEQVDRINAAISAMQKDLDAANGKIAAGVVGGAGKSEDPDKREHAQAFDRFFRKGVDNGLTDLQVKAKLTTQDDPNGGYLVPEEMEASVDRVLGTDSVFRSLARVIQVGTSSYKKLVNQGGTSAGWVGEEQARTETNTSTLREIAINTKELYANPAITQTSLDDSRLDIAAWLADEVSIEFAEQEGEAFITGDGVLKPRGILGHTPAANASYAWGNPGYIASGAASDFATVSTSVNPADALIDLYYGLKAGYRNNASWLMSDATMGRVRKFKDADGAYIWAAPSAAAEVATILGKPVYNDDNMPAVAANAFPIAFGDFRRAYLIVDRTGIRVLRDPYTSKPNVHFYTTKRVGGGIVNFEALKLLKIASS